jgi:predicted MFS family arabinose efflux permease
VPTLLVDAVSYVVSAAFMRSLPARRTAAPDHRPPMWSMIREGFGFVVRHPIMGPGMWTATAVNFVCGAQLALFPLYLVRVLHAPAGLVGVLLAADGLGTLIGASLTTRFTNAVGTARGVLIAGYLVVAGAFLIPVASGRPAYATFVLGTALFAGGVVIVSVTTRTYRQVASPPEQLSRVMATVRFVSWGAIPVGGVVAGALAGPLGARATLLIFAGVSVCAPVALLLSPIRRMRDLADADAPPTEREATVR